MGDSISFRFCEVFGVGFFLAVVFIFLPTVGESNVVDILRFGKDDYHGEPVSESAEELYVPQRECAARVLSSHENGLRYFAIWHHSERRLPPCKVTPNHWNRESASESFVLSRVCR